LLPFGPDGYKRAVPFRALLTELVARTPGARGAIFCDHEGESVELALVRAPPPDCEPLTPFDLRICGAQFAAVWLLLEEQSSQKEAGHLQEVKVRSGDGTMLCRVVKDGYYVMLLLAPKSASERSAVELRRLAERFAAEM
jgi:hypothetical protein